MLVPRAPLLHQVRIADHRHPSTPFAPKASKHEEVRRPSPQTDHRTAMMQLPQQPISNCYGFDRGTPVDRTYIHTFLSTHRAHVRGDAAEVKDDTYLQRYGEGQLRSVTVVDIDPTNPRVDLHADLGQIGALPSGAFDCIVLTQVLQLIPDPATALMNCRNALRPEGTLLLTAPCLSRISPHNTESDMWRFTPAGLSQLLDAWPGPVTVTGHGNLRTALAFLIGQAAEELSPAELAPDDPDFPIIACAIAQRLD